MAQVIDLTADSSMMDETISNEDDEDQSMTSENSSNDTTSNSSGDGDKLTEIKSRFSSCLLNQKIGGETAYFEVLRDPVNPGLFVDGLGGVGLPLSECDAERICKFVGGEGKGKGKGEGKGKGKGGK